MEGLEWQFYRQMFLIRQTEETLLSLFTKGVLFGTIHTSIGQEACAVGIINALDCKKDVIWSNHRNHGHFLAYCNDVEGLIAEMMGKASGVCGGFGGSQHLHKGNFYANGVLGGTVACAVGSALAEKRAGTGAITTVFLGDGAMGEGIVYESMNIAALWELPVLFVLEHNQYAQSTPFYLEHAGDLERRADPFGIISSQIDVQDVIEVNKITRSIVDSIRKTHKPYFLVLHTYRFASHSKGDDYRSQTEIDSYIKKDPLIALRCKLEEQDSVRLITLEQDCIQRVELSVNKATEAAFYSDQQFQEELSNW